jgi:hypothetical protein
MTDAELALLLGCTNESSNNFTLLWRKSEHMNTSTISQISWHASADLQGKTMTVIKSDLGWVFGGYNSMPWRLTSLDSAIWYVFEQPSSQGI